MRPSDVFSPDSMIEIGICHRPATTPPPDPHPREIPEIKVPWPTWIRAFSQNVECSGEIGAGCIQIDLPRKDFSTFFSPKSMAEFGTFQMYCNLQYIFSECPLWLRVLTVAPTSRRKGGSVLSFNKKLLLENSFGIPQDNSISDFS